MGGQHGVEQDVGPERLDRLCAVEREEIPVELVCGAGTGRVGCAPDDDVVHLVLDDVGGETVDEVVVAGEDEERPVVLVGLVRDGGSVLIGDREHPGVDVSVLVRRRQAAHDAAVLVGVGESRDERLRHLHVRPAVIVEPDVVHRVPRGVGELIHIGGGDDGGRGRRGHRDGGFRREDRDGGESDDGARTEDPSGGHASRLPSAPRGEDVPRPSSPPGRRSPRHLGKLGRTSKEPRT